MHEVVRPPAERRALLEEEPTSELIKSLLDGAHTLVRDELVLAKIQVQSELEKGKTIAKSIAVAGTLGFVALLLAAFTAVAALALVVAPWLAGVIVTAVFGGGAAAAAIIGLKKMNKLEPARALDHMKEEAEWIKKTAQDIQSLKRESTLH